MIAIIGAMDEEVAMLKEKMTEVQVESRACMEFYKGKLEGKGQHGVVFLWGQESCVYSGYTGAG